MNRRLWVDDERPVPDESWDLATSSLQANEMYDALGYQVVSLDYSLGGRDSGEEVIAHWAARQDWPGEIRLHSGSWSGRSLLARIIADHFPQAGGPKVLGAE